jgi:hypothetical protein
MAAVTSKLSGANDLSVGGVSGAEVLNLVLASTMCPLHIG